MLDQPGVKNQGAVPLSLAFRSLACSFGVSGLGRSLPLTGPDPERPSRQAVFAADVHTPTDTPRVPDPQQPALGIFGAVHQTPPWVQRQNRRAYAYDWI